MGSKQQHLDQHPYALPTELCPLMPGTRFNVYSFVACVSKHVAASCMYNIISTKQQASALMKFGKFYAQIYRHAPIQIIHDNVWHMSDAATCSLNNYSYSMSLQVDDKAQLEERKNFYGNVTSSILLCDTIFL